MLSLRNGLRALAKSVSPGSPPSGQRGLYARADGWWDSQSDGTEIRLNNPNHKVFSTFGAALARRESRRCKVLWSGASLAEGFNSSSFKTQPAQLLQAILRERFPTSLDVGGQGYFSVPTQGVTPAIASPITIVGGSIDPTTVGAAEAFSIGTSRNCWYTNGTGTLTFQCGPNATSVDLYHTVGTAGHAQGGQYKINGGAATQFSTIAGANAASKLNVPVTPYDTIEFSRGTGAGYIIIGGVEENGGDESKGISVGGAGHSGYYASIWSSAVAAGGWRDHWLQYAPDLIVMSDFGANDGSTGGQNKTPATFKSDLLTFISTIRSGGGVLATVPILLVADQDISAGITLNGGSWNPFVKAMGEIASADPTVGFCDLTQLMPSTSGNPKGLYAADLVHSASDGAAHKAMAYAVANAVAYGQMEGRATAYSDDNPAKTMMLSEYNDTVPTPAAGQVALWSIDGSALLMKDDGNVTRTIGGGTKVSALTAVTTPASTDEFPVNQGGTTKKMTLAQINNYSEPLGKGASAAQGPGFATDTYVTDSRVVLPQSRMQAGMVYRCRLVITKTAAGVATPIFNVRTGTAGTTADTARLTYTGVAQTAVIDTAYLEVQVSFRAVGASAIVACWLRFDHDLAATGFANATRGFQGQAVSGTFDSTTASMGIGISMNGGTSAAWTVQQCVPELFALAG